MIIWQKIKKLRTDRNMTQEALAAQFCVTAQAVSKWEQGLACPDIGLLVPLADFFGISVDELLREKSENKKAPFDLTLLEITKVRRYSGSIGSWTEYNFKNVSSIYIRRLDIKYVFRNESGDVIDYHSDYLFDLDPGFVRHSFARTRAAKGAVDIKIEIKDYKLA